jgi:NADPH-dependent 7-cyano-7-deazaguanine reductase QueF
MDIMRIITKKQYKQLKSLRKICRYLENIQNDLFLEACRITGEDDFTFDYMYNNAPMNTKEFLRHINIEVEE